MLKPVVSNTNRVPLESIAMAEKSLVVPIGPTPLATPVAGFIVNRRQVWNAARWQRGRPKTAAMEAARPRLISTGARALRDRVRRA